MTLTVQDVKDKKDWVADELKNALKQQFNFQSVQVSTAITRDSEQNPVLRLGIVNLDKPHDVIGQDVMHYAEQKLKQLAPDLKCFIHNPSGNFAAQKP